MRFASSTTGAYDIPSPTNIPTSKPAGGYQALTPAHIWKATVMRSSAKCKIRKTKPAPTRQGFNDPNQRRRPHGCGRLSVELNSVSAGNVILFRLKVAAALANVSM